MYHLYQRIKAAEYTINLPFFQISPHFPRIFYIFLLVYKLGPSKEIPALYSKWQHQLMNPNPSLTEGGTTGKNISLDFIRMNSGGRISSFPATAYQKHVSSPYPRTTGSTRKEQRVLARVVAFLILTRYVHQKKNQQLNLT